MGALKHSHCFCVLAVPSGRKASHRPWSQLALRLVVMWPACAQQAKDPSKPGDVFLLPRAVFSLSSLPVSIEKTSIIWVAPGSQIMVIENGGLSMCRMSPHTASLWAARILCSKKQMSGVHSHVCFLFSHTRIMCYSALVRGKEKSK